MITPQDAMDAANAIKEYCQSIPVNCEGCIFRQKDSNAVFFLGCKLNDPHHLPETWELEKIFMEDE